MTRAVRALAPSVARSRRSRAPLRARARRGVPRRVRRGRARVPRRALGRGRARVGRRRGQGAPREGSRRGALPRGARLRARRALGRGARDLPAPRRRLADGPAHRRAPSSTSPSIEIDHGDAARGWAMLDDAARRYPAHGLARPAIRRLDHARAGRGRRGRGARLARRARGGVPRHRAGRGDRLRARALAGARGPPQGGARRASSPTRAPHPYPFGGLTDDAFWHAAAIDERGRPLRRGDRPPARAALVARALGRVGELRAAALLAGAAPHRARSTATTSRTTPPRAASSTGSTRCTRRPSSATTPSGPRRAWRARTATRRPPCTLAKRLVDEFPESRYVPLRPRASARGAAPRQARACADYILRELARRAPGAHAAA